MQAPHHATLRHLRLVLGLLVLLATSASAQRPPPMRPSPRPPQPVASAPSLFDILRTVEPDSKLHPFASPAAPTKREAKDVISPAQIQIANTMLQEFVSDQQHYAAQARQYDQLLFSLRVIALMSSLGAALTLAFVAAEKGRKVALGLSIAAAAVPAVDQIFQVSNMYKASWRAAIDMSKTYDQCSDTFVKLASLPGTGSAFSYSIEQCRAARGKVVDAEMEVSLKPLETPARIEIKQ